MATPFTIRWIQPTAFGRFGFGPDTCPALEGVWNGRHWGRISGGHNMRAADGGVVPDETSRLCGTSDGAMTDITCFPGSYVATLGSRVAMRIVGVGSTGIEDYESEPSICEIVAAEDGRAAFFTPNPIRHLTAKPNSDGTFTLVWRYDPKRQGIAPEVFNVYANSGDGDVDFATPIDTVAYVDGQTVYTLTTEAVVGASRELWKFAVRGMGEDEEEEKNTFVVDAVGTPETPYDILEAAPAGQTRSVDPR